MSTSDGTSEFDLLRQRLDRHAHRLRNLEEWHDAVNPHLTALASMLKDADYGRHARESRARVWVRVRRAVTAGVALGAGVATMLHQFGVI